MHYDDQIHLEHALLHIKIKSLEDSHYIFLKYFKSHHAKQEAQLMVWGSGLEHPANKRWSLGSLVAIRIKIGPSARYARIIWH